jgi:hypothetical protein
MIAVANEASDGNNCSDGAKNGLNENWLPGMDSNPWFTPSSLSHLMSRWLDASS